MDPSTDSSSISFWISGLNIFGTLLLSYIVYRHTVSTSHKNQVHQDNLEKLEFQLMELNQKNKRVLYIDWSVRLLSDMNRLSMEYPEVDEVLLTRASNRAPYFYSPYVKRDSTYYRTRTYVYYVMNIVDAMLSAAECDPDTKLALEWADWLNYFKWRLDHPLFREIVESDAWMWGEVFRTFWFSELYPQHLENQPAIAPTTP